MEYVFITTNNANAVALMTAYGASMVSVHTEPTYILWVWHNATNDQVTQVSNSPEVIAANYISG